MTTPERIAEWYRQREADDRAKLAEIAARYHLAPSRAWTNCWTAWIPADAATVREIMSRNPISAEAGGFGAAQFEEFWRSFGGGA